MTTPLALEEPLPPDIQPKRKAHTQRELAAIAGISTDEMRELVRELRNMLAGTNQE